MTTKREMAASLLTDAEIDGILDANEIGSCDVCDEPHENGNQLDHCRECGNCWEHCSCVPKRTVESNLEEDLASGLLPW